MLLDYLCNKHVNTLIWAVSALTLISALHGLKYRIPIEVKRVMFSGEVMPVKQLRQWQLALPEAEFVNLYGPSEITCNCTYYRVKRIFEDDEILPLGKAFDGRKVFLMDDEGKEISTAEKTVKSVCQVSRSQKNIIIIRRKQEKNSGGWKLQTAWCGTIVQEIWDITVRQVSCIFPGEKISK